jgi:MFS family permease
MSELMARVLTGANATSYCISTAMAFWIIDRRGRRFLMLTGLSLQCFAYIMVAIAVAMLATAPQQVSYDYHSERLTIDTVILTLHSGELLPSLSCSSIMLHSGMCHLSTLGGDKHLIIYRCTWGMVPWIYQAEINSLAMRARYFYH